RHLHYGRVILDTGDAPIEIATGAHETGFIALAGEAAIETAGQRFLLTPYDALYVPRDSALRIAAGAAGCDLAEISAPVANRYPVQFVSFAAVRRDANLHFIAGEPSCERD